MATAKQLAALAKARKARLDKLKKTKPTAKRKVSTKSRPIKRTVKKTVKRTVKRAEKYFVFITKNGKRYYLQSKAGKYVWDSEKPLGYALTTAQRLGMTEGKKALAKLPKTCAVYIEKK